MDRRRQDICNDPKVSEAEKVRYGCPVKSADRMRMYKKRRSHHKVPGLDRNVVVPRRRLVDDNDVNFDPKRPGVGTIAEGTIGGQAIIGGGTLATSEGAFEPLEILSKETMQGIREGMSSYFGGGEAVEDGGLEMGDIDEMSAMNIDRGNMPNERINPYENLEPPEVPDPVIEPEPIEATPEVPSSVMDSVKNLLGDDATATMEVPEAGAEASEFSTELGLEELGDVAIDVGAYGAAETTAIGMGAVEGGAEASVAGFAAQVGAEVATDTAIGTGVAVVGEESAIGASALAGGLVLGPETLGASIVIGGLIAGITAIFGASKRKFDPKHPQAYRIHGGKEGRDMAKKFDKHDATKKYAQMIRDDPGKVFLVVLDKLGKNGKHIVQIVKQLDTDGLAKAQAVLEKNPDAYKGYDLSVLKALGLNPNLSTQPWNKDPSTLWRDGDIQAPTEQEVSKASDDLKKLNTDLTNQAIFKKNKKMLDEGDFKGSDRDAMINKLKQFAFDNGIDYDTGKLLTPDQVSKLDPNSRVKDFVPPKVTGKDIMDKMRKKLDGDTSIEFSKGEMDWLKSQGFQEGKSNKGTLDMINQNLIYKASMDKYNKMPDGNDKKYMYQQIQGWLWDHNMNPNGTYMNPDQIKNKPSRPPSVPPDIQKEFDKNKADYEKNKEQYDKDYKDYQDKMSNYKDFQDLMLQRQNINRQITSKYGKGEDYTDLQKQLDDINDKLNDAYEKMDKGTSPDDKPDPKDLHASVAPLRRKKAIQQNNNDGN